MKEKTKKKNEVPKTVEPISCDRWLCRVQGLDPTWAKSVTLPSVRKDPELGLIYSPLVVQFFCMQGESLSSKISEMIKKTDVGPVEIEFQNRIGHTIETHRFMSAELTGYSHSSLGYSPEYAMGLFVSCVFRVIDYKITSSVSS